MSKIDATLLIIDDDADVLTSARIFLKRHFQKIITESHPREINKVISQEEIDLVLLDMNFTKGVNDGREGMYWLKHILELKRELPVILMTAYGEVNLAVNAIKLGATDFIVKPWVNEDLLESLKNGLVLSQSKKKFNPPTSPNKKASPEREQIDLKELAGNSPKMQEIIRTLEKVGKTDANILILGENGTGKTLIAKAIHQISNRSFQTFVDVDLGAINENLFESELFGHVKGAFTDAHQDKPGRFEVAEKGTLFLDEIGNLPLHLQSKLLSVLQNRMVMRVGSTEAKQVDVRLICATNMPLYELVEKNEFRQDLLYRINTVEIHLPPLRERVEDIPDLAVKLVKKLGEKYQKPYLRFTPKAIQQLQDYHWPGNIRELEHTIERTAILAEGDIIDDQHLHLQSKPGSEINESFPQTLNLEEMEYKLIDKAIRKHSGNISKAAQDLGLTRAALYRRMEKYGL